MKKLVYIGTFVFSISFLSMSCGNSDQNKANQTDHSAHNTETETPVQSEPNLETSNSIVVESNDQMQFNVSELHVKVSEPINLTLKHVGKMAKEIMGHNLVILKSGTDIAKFTEAALQAKDSEYIPQSEDIIAHTKLIGGGEESTIDFTINEPGTYDFICSFPGHAGIMKGIIIVE